MNLGKLQEQYKQYRQWMQGEATRKEQVEKLPALRMKLDRDETELAKWSEQVKALEGRAGTGPRVGLVHDLARVVDGFMSFVEPDAINANEWNAGVLAIQAYGDQYGQSEERRGGKEWVRP